MNQIKLPGGLKFPSDVDDLKGILNSVEPRIQPIPRIRKHVSRFVDGADMDEVFPNIWLGDCDAASNISYLQRHGVTHILNAADNRTGPAQVKTGPEFYKDTKFHYLGLDLIDLPFANVSRHFETASAFIHKALEEKGIVLVHCRQGRSRSASIVIGFLMMHKNFTACDALRRLREFREVRPNNSFLQQIADYDLQLFRERLASCKSSSSESDSSSDSEVGRESIDSDSFKTVSSEPISDPSPSISRKMSALDTNDSFEVSSEFESSRSEVVYIPEVEPKLVESKTFAELYPYASFKELSAEVSIQLVIDSDYDSDDESSDTDRY